MTIRGTAGVVATLAPGILLGLGSCTVREAPARVFRLEEATVADINAAFDEGVLTCRGLVERYLRRLAAYDSAGQELNSMITLNPRALEIAGVLDEERMATGPRSALHCIPVVLKDNIDTGDMPTSNGSVILKDAVAPDDAFVARRLRGAGALVLGKASLGEFAGGNSYNTVDGQTINAYHRLRAAGGSSSGSAVAVAANLATLGVGTDTSQSVRIPAAFNGLAALRPTTGLISRDGIAPKNLNFDTAGPMARTVTDLAILLTAMAAPDPADPDGLSRRVFGGHPAGPSAVELDYTRFLERGALEGARLGIARDYFGGDPEIDALAEAAIAAMRELGAEIVDPVTFDGSFVDGVRTVADYRFRADWEAYVATLGDGVPNTVAEYLEIYRSEVAASALPAEATVLSLLERASTTSAEDPAYIDLLENRLPRYTELKTALFDEHGLDALVYPTSASFAPPIRNPVQSASDPAYVADEVRSPQTLAGYSSVGFPAVVVPMGVGSAGLPMTISFLGRPYEEGKLIGFAFDYEQATMMRRPSPLAPPPPGRGDPVLRPATSGPSARWVGRSCRGSVQASADANRSPARRRWQARGPCPPRIGALRS